MGQNMKKIWKKPEIKRFSCDLNKLQGDIENMPENELLRRLLECGYPGNKEEERK